MSVFGRFLFSWILPLFLNLSLQGQLAVKNSFILVDATEMTVRIITENKTGYTIEWGDGNIDSIASNEKFTRTYADPYTGMILLKGLDGSAIRTIDINGGFAFDIAELYAFTPHLESLILGGKSACFGNLAEKPSSLSYIDVQKGDFYGEFNRDRLNSVIRLRVVEGNQIKLNIADFDKCIKYIGITGKNEIFGSLDSLDYPNLTHLDIKGNNTITGDVGKMKNIPPIFVLQGNQAVNTYTSANLKFTSTPKLFNLTSPFSSLDTEEIDQLIIDLDRVAKKWKSTKRIFLGGAHSTTSENSAAARKNLSDKQVKLYVN